MFTPVIHGSYDPMSDLRSECGDRILRSDVIRDPTDNADPDPRSGSDLTIFYDPDPGSGSELSSSEDSDPRIFIS